MAEKTEWISERVEKSNTILKYLLDQKTNERYPSIDGLSLKKSTQRFLANRPSKVRGVLRLWEREPYLLFHFPAFIKQPIPVRMFLHISIPLPLAELRKDDDYGWMVKDTAPSWLITLLQQFYFRKDRAKILYGEYVTARDAEYNELLNDSESIRRYDEFYTKLIQNIQLLARGTRGMVLEGGFQLNLEKIEKDQENTTLNHLIMRFSTRIREQLDNEGKSAFDFLESTFRKLRSVPIEQFKIDKLLTLPKLFSSLGAERARVLGFLSEEISTQANQVEWSALSNQPYFWFSPDDTPLHDITTYDWTPILSLEDFSVSITFDDVIYFTESQTMPFIGVESIIGVVDIDVEEGFTDFEEVIADLEDELEIDLDQQTQLLIEPNLMFPIPLKDLLSEDFLYEQINFVNEFLVLTPQDFIHLEGLPQKPLLFNKSTGTEFLSFCWDFLQEKFKDDILESLQRKYALLIEQPLKYLYEHAGKDLSQIKEQVEILVDELSKVSTNIEKAKKTIIDIAGGWTPTWIEKEIYILKKVLENADFKELSRENLLSQWYTSLKSHGSKRSERELMYNLRGLERTHVLEKYGIYRREESRKGAGAKSTIFFLRSETSHETHR